MEESQIIRTEYSELMKKSYIDYAMSVIISRALPDVRDGLKPVQRRTLYDMYELGIRYDRPYRKCARIVGDTMGKYHPHGDSSIYESLVVMAQEFKKGKTLVDGHGNGGSDGDRLLDDESSVDLDIVGRGSGEGQDGSVTGLDGGCGIVVFDVLVVDLNTGLLVRVDDHEHLGVGDGQLGSLLGDDLGVVVLINGGSLNVQSCALEDHESCSAGDVDGLSNDVELSVGDVDHTIDGYGEAGLEGIPELVDIRDGDALDSYGLNIYPFRTERLHRVDVCGIYIGSIGSIDNDAIIVDDSAACQEFSVDPEISVVHNDCSLSVYNRSDSIRRSSLSVGDEHCLRPSRYDAG